MTERIRLDDLTSNQLDNLYAETDRLTAELTDYDKRVQQVEELLRIAHETSNRSEAERARAVMRAEHAEAETTATATAAAHLTSLVLDRAERAEAAVARVRGLHHDWEAGPGHCAHCQDGMGTPLPWPCPTLRALDQPAPGTAATQATDDACNKPPAVTL
ncbi:hypothetical protein SUDANB1_00435 [Streptomyces sp. enrichment culture]|uniref:hypothetical protein n=1 Tax=Streptomyces sp. enrichment culture TaxID=1795815 RepID=UPI003F5597E8